MSKITGFFLFAFGAGLGTWITWSKTRKHYEEKTQQAIDDVKAAYKANITSNDINDGGDEVTLDVEDGVTENDILPKRTTPYEISATEYGTRKGYTAIQLILFADDVLADEEGVIYKDEEVGADILERLYENEDDAVYIRNDTIMRDFEIVTDAREYGDVTFQSPFDPEDL